MQTLNEKVKVIRLLKGLTQEQVGETLGITKSTYNRMEKGHIDIAPAKLVKLAQLFGMTPEEVTNYRSEHQQASESTQLDLLRKRVTDLDQRVVDLERSLGKTHLLMVESRTFFDCFYQIVMDTFSSDSADKKLWLEELNRLWGQHVSYLPEDEEAHRKSSPLQAAKQSRIEDAVMSLRMLMTFHMDQSPDLWPK